MRFGVWTGFLLVYYLFFGLHASYDTAKEFKRGRGWKNIEEGNGVDSKDIVPSAPM